MSEYKITCSSTCDLSKAHLDGLGISYVKYHYIIDGKEYDDDLFTSRTAKEFYDGIDAGAMPTTSQVTPDELIDVFEPILKAGYDLLHIEFSSGLTGSFRSAVAAREEMEKKYPERKILLVDSLAASSGYGLLVDKAAELKEGGMDIDGLYAWLEENKLRVRHWFFSNNLAHFKRGGRISGASAAIGAMLGICPVMDINSEGKLIVRKKIMGKKKAIRELLRLMSEQAEGGEEYGGKCFLSHSRTFDDAETLAKMIDGKFLNLKESVKINDIGAVIGSHTGPGTLSLFYFSDKKRTLDSDI